MIPLRDNIPPRTFPVVNYVIIGLTGLAFFGQLAAAPSRGHSIEEQYGMIPARVWHPDREVVVIDRIPGRYETIEQERIAAPAPFNPWLTLLTCIFLHGSWMHFAGNMWFLYIFGDNVEDRLGHFGYAIFYLASGILASVTHLVTNAASPIPTIGASGAIAGVMGAYSLLYPRATVMALVPLFGFMQMITLPAPFFLGIWFVMQFFQGAMAITTTQTGGVAWWAHIGGFVVGLAMAGALSALGRTSPPATPREQDSLGIDLYRYRR